MLLLLKRELRHRITEILLGALIISLVISVVLVQRAISKTAEDEVNKLLHKIGNNMLVVPQGMKMSDFYMFRFGPETMPQDYSEKIRSSKINKDMGTIRPVLYGNIVKNGTTLVISGEDIKLPPRFRVDAGVTWAALGKKAALAFGVLKGSTFQIKGVTLKVIAIVRNRSGDTDSSIFMPLKAAQKILGKPGKINAMYIGGCTCSTDIASLAAEVERTLPGVRAITVAGTVKAQEDSILVMKNYSTIISIAAIILVAATVLVMILSQIKRYIRELGLLIAMGSPLKHLISMFLIKAMLMGGIGSLAGFFISTLITNRLGVMFLQKPLEPDYRLFLPILGITIFVSILGTVIPAYRISELDPANTLREV